jgi:hypothetical protein
MDRQFAEWINNQMQQESNKGPVEIHGPDATRTVVTRYSRKYDAAQNCFTSEQEWLEQQKVHTQGRTRHGEDERKENPKVELVDEITKERAIENVDDKVDTRNLASTHDDLLHICVGKQEHQLNKEKR